MWAAEAREPWGRRRGSDRDRTDEEAAAASLQFQKLHRPDNPFPKRPVERERPGQSEGRCDCPRVTGCAACGLPAVLGGRPRGGGACVPMCLAVTSSERERERQFTWRGRENKRTRATYMGRRKNFCFYFCFPLGFRRAVSSSSCRRAVSEGKSRMETRQHRLSL